LLRRSGTRHPPRKRIFPDGDQLRPDARSRGEVGEDSSGCRHAVGLVLVVPDDERLATECLARVTAATCRDERGEHGHEHDDGRSHVESP
jgi:hypothetical protein